jgi:hypothetical protein
VQKLLLNNLRDKLPVDLEVRSRTDIVCTAFFVRKLLSVQKNFFEECSAQNGNKHIIIDKCALWMYIEDTNEQYSAHMCT